MKQLFSEIKNLDRRSYGLTICAGLGTILLSGSIDWYLAKIGLHAEATFVDNILLGLAVALLIFTLEVQHLLREQKREFQVVFQMNHHIRNALQTIIFENSRNADREAAERVEKATARIEWALREIRTFETKILEMPAYLTIRSEAAKEPPLNNP
jgi:hypothetical protein